MWHVSSTCSASYCSGSPLHWKECRPHWVTVPGMHPTREENWGEGRGEGEMADAMRREDDQLHVYLFVRLLGFQLPASQQSGKTAISLTFSAYTPIVSTRPTV